MIWTKHVDISITLRITICQKFSDIFPSQMLSFQYPEQDMWNNHHNYKCKVHIKNIYTGKYITIHRNTDSICIHTPTHSCISVHIYLPQIHI